MSCLIRCIIFVVSTAGWLTVFYMTRAGVRHVARILRER